MKLQSLSLDMNPWLQPPANISRDSRVNNTRIVSPTVAHYIVPSLKELIHRVLFSTMEGSDDMTVLESIGGSAAIPDFYPAHLWAELHRCDSRGIPKRDVDMHPSPSKRARRQISQGHGLSFLSSRAAEKRRANESEESFGVGLCPNKSHGARRIFIQPAEERHTWERNIAGHQVPFPGIPVLWRGCSPGCLDFLQPADEQKDQPTPAEVRIETDGSDGEDESVQAVDLESFDDDDSEFE